MRCGAADPRRAPDLWEDVRTVTVVGADRSGMLVFSLPVEDWAEACSRSNTWSDTTTDIARAAAYDRIRTTIGAH